MADGTVEIPQEVLDHLKLREGWKTNVYLDSLGKPTAGMGHLLLPAERDEYPVGSTVPDDVLNQWQVNDTMKAYTAAVSQAGQLQVDDQDFINALCSVNFQLGTAWNLTFKNTWALMIAQKWEAAAEAVAQSAWNKQTPVRVQDFQAAIRALIPGE